MCNKESDLKTKKDPEEIIEFEYYDKIKKQTVLIKDKRKIKTALDEFDKQEQKQLTEILKNECYYNPKLDFRSYEEETLSFEENLEQALQEVVDKISKKESDQERIRTFLKDNIALLSEKQIIVLFLHYFLGFSISETANKLSISRQRVSKILQQSCKNLKENT